MADLILLIADSHAVFPILRSGALRGRELVVVSPDRGLLQEISKLGGAACIHGAPTHSQTLEQAGIQRAATCLCMAEHDETNFCVGYLASRRYLVPSVICTANEPENEARFAQAGLLNTVSVPRILTGILEERASYRAIVSSHPLADDSVRIFELQMTLGMPAVQKSIRDLVLGEQVLIATVYRGSTAVIPNGTQIIQARDRLLVVCAAESFAQTYRALTGEKP